MKVKINILFYKNYFKIDIIRIANPSTYGFSIGAKLFELISAKLTIQNNSVIYNQISVAKWFLATLTFSQSTFYNLVTKDKGIRLSQATINITNCIFCTNKILPYFKNANVIKAI